MELVRFNRYQSRWKLLNPAPPLVEAKLNVLEGAQDAMKAMIETFTMAMRFFEELEKLADFEPIPPYAAARILLGIEMVNAGCPEWFAKWIIGLIPRRYAILLADVVADSIVTSTLQFERSEDGKETEGTGP